MNLHRRMKEGMRDRKKLLTPVLAALLVLTQLILPGRVQAEEPQATWPKEIEIESASGILMDLETGEILYAKDDKASHYPASITKLMTALLAVEKSKPDEMVTFSYDAVSKNEVDSAHIARDVGEQMRMEDTLYGLLLASANECAYAIAEHVGANMGGDYQTFIQAMNDRARELGCVNTHFANSSGLHDDRHHTCAYDMALIARAAYQNETIRKIVATKRYEIPPTNKHADPTPLNNTHAMLSSNKTSAFLYEGCVGGKTGYTDEAKRTLVTYVERDDKKLVSVTMYTAGKACYRDTIALMDWGLDHFKKVSLRDDSLQTKVDEAIRASGRQGLSWEAEGNLLLPREAGVSDLAVRLEASGTGDRADASKEKTVGEKSGGEETDSYKLSLMLGDRLLISQPLTAVKKADEPRGKSALLHWAESVGNCLGRPGRIAILLIFLLLLLLALALGRLLLVRRRRRNRRRHRDRTRGSRWR